MKIFTNSIFALVVSTWAVQCASNPLIGESTPGPSDPTGTPAPTDPTAPSDPTALTEPDPELARSVPLNCVDRTTRPQCQTGDTCVWRDPICIPADGAPCGLTLVEDDEGDVWEEVRGEGCPQGFVCTVEDIDPSGETATGVCKPESCWGNKVPGQCHGGDCEPGTERVTICHRTCSAKNPWVRITIDKSAWIDPGCGHQIHSVNDCPAEDKSPWGNHTTDYLIKDHGSREHVLTTELGNDVTREKAYWRKWEPACPYVRNGICCDLDITNEDDRDYNPCCGECTLYEPIEDNTGSKYCKPGDTGILLLNRVGGPYYLGPDGDVDPFDIFYNIKTENHPVEEPAAAVSFQIKNPYPSDTVTMYIEYHKPDEENIQWELPLERAWDKVCETYNDCLKETLTAGCLRGDIEQDPAQPSTLIQVYFVEKKRYDLFPGGAKLDECCINHASANNVDVSQYTFLMRCECPSNIQRRLVKY